MGHVTRESPWGPIAVADAHVHFFSHRFFEKLSAQKPDSTPGSIAARLEWQAPPSDSETLAAQWAHELDRHGVAHAAVIASVPGDEESVTAAAGAYPGRLFAFAMVDPVHSWRPSAMTGIRAACLFPAMHCYSIQGEEAQGVFRWAAERSGAGGEPPEQGGPSPVSANRAVFVHCGVLTVGVRKRLGLPSKFDMRFSNPVDLHAVALRYPEVPIVVPHFGAGYFREALMLADLCPNVYLDTSSSNSWMRYQESHLDLRQVFRRALDVVGPRRLLFGSDSSYFPRGWHHQIFEDQARALYELGVSAADARLIFSENLLRIMGR